MIPAHRPDTAGSSKKLPAGAGTRLAMGKTMPPYIWHFATWWMLLAVVPVIWALRAHDAMHRDERMYRLTFVVAPILLGVIWLHGLLFDPPSNWAGSQPLNFVGFWFRPHELAFYQQHQTELLALAAPGVLMAAILVYRGSKALDHAWNRRTAAISYGLQISAWLLLRHLPEVLLELGGGVSLATLGSTLWAEALHIAAAVAVPLPLIIIAYLFARQSVEARPTIA